METTEKIKIESPYPPAITTFGPGQTYACGSNKWVKIPDGTTQEDIEWIPTIKHEPKVVVPIVEYFIKSSNGKEEYRVATVNGTLTCTCVGYSFRSKCKHVEQVKLLISK